MRKGVLYGGKGPPGPPGGPTLRVTVEGLRGRGQLTASLGDVLEVTAPSSYPASSFQVLSTLTTMS